MVRSLAPALAAGTTTVIKMPGQTAQTNALVSRILSEAPSLPRGVINLFSESGADGSKILIASPDVPVISFTGRPRRGARFPPSVRSGSSVSVSNSAERRRTWSSTTPISMRHCPSSKNR